LRVAFAGTPAFASAALIGLADAGHEIVLVLTRPDRPAGRGLRLARSEVALTAGRLGLPLSQPATLRDSQAVEELRACRPDVLVVAAYGLILPRPFLDAPAQGCLNIHASLLPRWRGAAPVQRALLAGDLETGVCIMRMEEGLDTGPVLLAKRIPIGPRDTAGGLTDQLARLGAGAIVEALSRLASIEPIPQDPAKATYAPKVSREEAALDWNLSADELDRRVRAFNPVPGAEASVGGTRIKVWECEPASGLPRLAAGELLREGDSLIVGCGAGALRLLSVQRPGAKRLGIREFLRGHPLGRQ